MAQDDYYYEIQLTNKQLVFYFMAGAAGLILSFLAGVMVGRGVDPAAGAAAPPQQLAEGKVVAERAAPTPSDYSYPQRLEADRPSAALERPRPETTATPPPPPAATPQPTPARPAPTPTPPPKPRPTPVRAAPSLPKALAPAAAGHAVQVGAFKDKASADSVMRGLKAKGMPAYVKAPAPGSGGLFTVRVGPYRDRADADLVAARLKADKFKPYIIKQ
ncbi:MAG: SPOR domain-containing protein [Acidobacteria bacterium]|nr:SPOR domain-containing protein [Acidobacteriota bacterium]